MNVRRFFTAVGMAAVAGVAGAISYTHQQHLAAGHDQTHALSLFWPLCVDGLVTVTAVAMATDRAAGFRPRIWALCGFWLGVVISVATNWLATNGGLINHAISAFPAVAFLFAIESLSGKPRPLRIPKGQVATLPDPKPAVAPAAKPAKVATPRPRGRKAAPAVAKAAAIIRQRPELKPQEVATLADVSRTTARRAVERERQLQEAS